MKCLSLIANTREHIEGSRVGKNDLDKCHSKNDWSIDSGYFYPTPQSK